jgi:hypothetical protein
MCNFIKLGCCFFISNVCFSQIFKGKVIDAKTDLPVMSASIYINGSSFGTISNENGLFELDTKGVLQPIIMISTVNYNIAIIKNSSSNIFHTIKLQSKVEELKEVVLEIDKFSRALKMGYFKKYFIGDNEATSKFKILNEDDIHLFFNKKEKSLIASSDQSLKIYNEYLGYEILYDLQGFEILFSNDDLNHAHIKQSYFAGATYFKDVSKGKEKFKKRRKNAYLGSSMHFIQSLYQNKLKENDFRLFHKGFETNPDLVFTRIDTLDYVVLNYLKEKELVVIYKDLEKRTDIHFKEKQIAITKNGNFFPTTSLFYNGFMANNKNGLLLPLDYEFTKN